MLVTSKKLYNKVVDKADKESFPTMASSSASLELKSKYDVFLSFRGMDTRHSIVSHLYEELASKGIVTFKDDKRLEIGDHISDELHRAIEGSDYVVVIISKNYATSKWCLMELQLIMELQKMERLDVFPVFYGVQPSSVRHQRGSFRLGRYQRPEEADMIPRWRKALKRVANLSGVESKLCNDEATMVRDIVEDISRRMTLMHEIDFKNIVGVDAHMQGLKILLDMDSKNDEVRMIGIWGMGGIGKTTIAKCLYARLSSQFKTSYFTDDIKCIPKDSDQLKNLQYKLLHNTLGDDNRPWCVEAGRNTIAKRLGNQKVLLVLDGVDKLEQIHGLAKETRWFGNGSRIIITTRDRGLLNSCGVKSIYEVKCLDDKDSLEMFKMNAFEEGRPPSDDFEQLSIRAARLAHGLPSAIQAYALFLCGRANSLEEWEEAVSGLESTPDEDTMKILQLSFEGLARTHQDVFLHVACLFNGETFKRVASLLDGTTPNINLMIKVLVEKCLIHITTNGCVILHKFVEQMGREIMLDSNRFLGNLEKIQNALACRKGTELTECISLHTCEMPCAFSMKTSFINNMHSLKFLKVYEHVDNIESRLHVIPDDQSHQNISMPYGLKLLHWDAFPLTTLPLMQVNNFLVELSLRHSNLEKLWNETQIFPKLRKLDVTGSKNLKQLPDLSYSKNLDELCLEQCTNLKGIPELIKNIDTLSKLTLSYYNGPMSIDIWKNVFMLRFPTARVEMQLEDISITGKIRFFVHGWEGYAKHFSMSSERQIPATTTVSVQQAPMPIQEFNNSSTLNIRRFHYRKNTHDRRPVTFDRCPDFPGLKELKLVNLNIQNFSDGISHFKILEKLDLSGNDFEYLPENMHLLIWLKKLWLRNCSKLKELPNLPQVESLTLFNCRNLTSLVKLSDANQDPGIYRLLEFCLDNCKKVKPLSEQLSCFTKLTYLDLRSHDFETLPSSIRDLTSLVTLCINNCKKLKSVGELPMSLQFLDAEGCDSLGGDALERFKAVQNKEVQSRSACFQETEMLCYEQDYQHTKSRLSKFLRCSYICATFITVLSILIMYLLHLRS